MKYILCMVLACVGIVIVGAYHGMTGAILLGLAAILLDGFWLNLRYGRILKSPKKSFGVVYGFLIRLLSTVVFLKIGQEWLTPHSFYVCAGILLTLPMWNLAGAIFLKQRGLE